MEHIQILSKKEHREYKCFMFIVCCLCWLFSFDCYVNELDEIYVRCHFLRSFFYNHPFIRFTQLNLTHFQWHSANNKKIKKKGMYKKWCEWTSKWNKKKLTCICSTELFHVFIFRTSDINTFGHPKKRTEKY